jgi:hypothetical protein
MSYVYEVNGAQGAKGRQLLVNPRQAFEGKKTKRVILEKKTKYRRGSILGAQATRNDERRCTHIPVSLHMLNFAVVGQVVQYVAVARLMQKASLQ